jgi:benzodiazapine receptor
MDKYQIKLSAFTAIPLGVGALTAFLIRNGLSIYKTLNHPALSPPIWLLPIIWTALYILMGFGSYLAVSSPSHRKGEALRLYGTQLLLNFLRSLVFFNLKNYLLAFLILIFLWYSVVKMISAFWTVNPDAAVLQVPYLLWITFTGYLNLGIIFLN